MNKQWGCESSLDMLELASISTSPRLNKQLQLFILDQSEHSSPLQLITIRLQYNTKKKKIMKLQNKKKIVPGFSALS